MQEIELRTATLERIILQVCMRTYARVDDDLHGWRQCCHLTPHVLSDSLLFTMVYAYSNIGGSTIAQWSLNEQPMEMAQPSVTHTEPRCCSSLIGDGRL